MKYLCLMNVDKMNKLTKLNLSLKDNNIEEIELNKWLDWSGNRLSKLSVNLKENELIEIGYNDNMKLEEVNDNCEVYLDIWDGENEDAYLDYM